MKKRLTKDQEFEIMKLVLDKFLWAGFIILMYGLYKIFTGLDLVDSFIIMVTGAVILIIFMFLILKEYEVQK